MGLLNATPDDWFELIRTAAQNRSPDDGSADAARGSAPSWLPRSQRAPLSLAGPDLAANEPWPSASVAPVVTVPQAGQPADMPNWAQAPSGNPFAGSPRPAEQNLTVRALRMKGVPEADIAAAGGNPELMKQPRILRPALLQHRALHPALPWPRSGTIEHQPSRRCAASRLPAPLWTRARRF
jgi:hypothetical protein